MFLKQKIILNTRKSVRNSDTNLPKGGVWSTPVENTTYDFEVPPTAKLFYLTDIKKYFQLHDMFGIENWKIDWTKVFYKYDGIYVSERAIDLMGNKREKSKLGLISSVLVGWKPNTVLWNRFPNKSEKKKTWKDPYLKKKKWGKLFTHPSSNVLPSIPIKGLSSIEMVGDLSKADTSKVQGLTKRVSKVFKSDSVLGQLKRLNPTASVRFRPKISFVSINDNWVLNYDKGTLEVNLSKATSGLASKTSLTRNVVFGLGLAYYDQCLRSEERVYWKRWTKREKHPLNLGNFSLSPPIKADKFRSAFAYGWTTWGFPSWDSPYKNMVGEFLEGSPETEDLFDVDNPLGIQLPKERFDYFDMDLDKEFIQKNPNGEDLKITTREILDLSGASILIYSIMEAIKTKGLSAKYPELRKFTEADLLTFEDGFLKVGGDAALKIGDNWVANLKREFLVNDNYDLSLENDLCFLSKEFLGLGIPTRMMECQMTTALKLGVETIECYAGIGSYRVEMGGGEYEDISMTGYKVWAKYGYDGKITQFKFAKDRDKGVEYLKAVVLSKLDEMTEEESREVFEEIFEHLPAKHLKSLSDRGYTDFDFQNKILFENYLDTPDWQIFYEKNDLKTFIENNWELRHLPNMVQATLSAYGLVWKEASMQDLMDTEIDGVPFQDFWAENGRGWRAVIDLSEGVRSLAVLTMDMYRKKKAAQLGDDLFPRSRKASEEYEYTKAFGAISTTDISLMGEALREVKQELKEQPKRVASKWLSFYNGD